MPGYRPSRGRPSGAVHTKARGTSVASLVEDKKASLFLPQWPSQRTSQSLPYGLSGGGRRSAATGWDY